LLHEHDKIANFYSDLNDAACLLAAGSHDIVSQLSSFNIEIVCLFMLLRELCCYIALEKLSEPKMLLLSFCLSDDDDDHHHLLVGVLEREKVVLSKSQKEEEEERMKANNNRTLIILI